jgi:hypothetical protein
MRDLIGNIITEGNMLQWMIRSDLRAVICKVIAVTDGGLAIPGEGNAVTPPMLVVALQIPVDGAQRGREPQVGDFIRVVDPSSEQLLEGLGRKPS